MPRVRFSIRTLLVAIAILAVVLSLSVQFGPHLIWRTLHSGVSLGVVAAPAKPLVAAPSDEEFVQCRIGPVSLRLPRDLSHAVEVKSGIGGRSVLFQGDNRSLIVLLPQSGKQLFQKEVAKFPGKANFTFPRLYKEIATAQSSDFSFAMSRQELAWHRWLLTTRHQTPLDLGSVEFLEKPELEGILIHLPLVSLRTFEWETVDLQWEGTLYLKANSVKDIEWMRQVCTTFALDGDPRIFAGRDADEIKAMVQLSEDGLNKQR